VEALFFFVTLILTQNLPPMKFKGHMTVRTSSFEDGTVYDSSTTIMIRSELNSLAVL